MESADKSLKGKAADLVTKFVGHPVGSKDDPNSTGFGIMSHRGLEKAIDDNDEEVLNELKEKMKPIHNKLKKMYGDKVTLYRGQTEVDADAEKRNTLSWSFNPKVAMSFAGVHGRKALTNDDIKNAVDKFKDTNEVTVRGKTYKRIDDDEIGLYGDNGESFITSIEGKVSDLAKWLRSEQEDQRYSESKDKERASKYLHKKEIPVDDILWTTDRANQLEAIVRNHKDHQMSEPPTDHLSTIRAAFDKHDGKDGLPGYARIADVRNTAGLPKEHFDSTIKHLRKHGHISLSLMEGRKKPTQDEIDNAYHEGGECYSLMCNKRDKKLWHNDK